MNEQSTDDIKRLWQEQDGGTTPQPSLQELRSRARTEASKLKTRNRLELAGAAALVVILSYEVCFANGLFMRIGLVMLIGAAIFGAWQLHVRSDLSRPQNQDLAEPWMRSYRRSLERERDMLASVGYWYLGPFLPGLILWNTGRLLEEPKRWPYITALAVVYAVIFGVVIRWNNRASRRRQQQIDELDAANPPPS